MVKLCQDYTNSQGKTYKGCRQPLKWVNATPLTKVGEWPGGKPKYAGAYEHYDGTPSRHDEDNPPSQKAYQATYPQQIEKQDQEQARLQTAGLTDAKSSSLFEQFTNTKLEPFMDILEQKIDKLIDNGDTKAAANNVGIIGISRDLGEFKKAVLDEMQNLRKSNEELAKSIDNKGQKIDAFLSVHSFKGADEIYQSSNPAAGEVMVADASEDENDAEI